jgi:DNA gyrase subunit B/topoisomerase-4 subunit B
MSPAAGGPGRYAQSRARLADCALHGAGSGAELILVEGDSAHDSVVAVRNDRTQAVLPLRGKPLNAWTASRDKVEQQVLFQQLADALGLPGPAAGAEPGIAALRFERVVLLFDPDADGIHIGALVQLYLARWLPALVAAGALWLVRAPMFELVDADGVVHHALTPEHRDRIVRVLRPTPDMPPPQMRALRAIGAFAPATLRRLCVDPATRLARAVTPQDIAQVVAVFGGGR